MICVYAMIWAQEACFNHALALLVCWLSFALSGRREVSLDHCRVANN